MVTATKLDEMPDVLTAEQFRRALGIGIQQARRMLREGKVRSRRIGHKYLVPREAVREYLAGTDA